MIEEERTTGMGLWTDAREMLDAAKHLAASKKFELGQPLYYLLGHSLELAFKSFIRARGANLADLKNIGHDLDQGLIRAEQKGLGELVNLSEKEKAVITMINQYYKFKEFEYRVTGAKKYPLSSDLISLIERLLNATESTCIKSINF